MTDKYITGIEAGKILGVHRRTLYGWDKRGLIDVIRTPGGKRLYNVDKYLRDNGKQQEKLEDIKTVESEGELNKLGESKERLNISYVRVSSSGQKDDLERQKRELQKAYPKNIIIEDIGSGLNLNKRGIRKIIKLGIAGKINTLIVAYKDRLTRFGYELIEDIIKEYSKGEIIVLNAKDKEEPEEELVKDVLQIMNVYVAKLNGMRKYNKKKKE